MSQIWTQNELVVIDEDRFSERHAFVSCLERNTEEEVEFILEIVERHYKGPNTRCLKNLHQKNKSY